MISQYKDLLFWKTAFETTRLVIELGKLLPTDRVSLIVMSQLLRSSASVGANIAEGFGRYKGKEYKRFLQISLGSANETDYWLNILLVTYPKLNEKINVIIEKNLETIKMLAKSLKTISSSKS